MRAFEFMVEPLMRYSLEITNDMTPQKLTGIRLIYEIIREAAADLHGRSNTNRDTATKYFNSPLFLKHCEAVGIDYELMLYIVNNPEKYVNNKDFYELESGNESAS